MATFIQYCVAMVSIRIIKYTLLLTLLYLSSQFVLQDGKCSINSQCAIGYSCQPQRGLCMTDILNYMNSLAVISNAVAIEPDKKYDVSIDSSNAKYYYFTPEYTDAIYEIAVDVCYQASTAADYQVQIDALVDTKGRLDDSNFHRLNSDQCINKTPFYTNQSFCEFLIYTQIQFQDASNGKVQKFVLKVSTQSPDLVSFKMKMEVQVFMPNQLLLIMGIVFLSASAIIAISVICVCCYRRWKRRREQSQKLQYKQHMLDYIRQQLPEVDAKDAHLPKSATCSICLSDYEPQHKVRKLSCFHVFHSECIDSWCMKNLSCPVCRFQLDQESIKKKKSQKNNFQIKWEVNELSARDNLMDNQGKDKEKNIYNNNVL